MNGNMELEIVRGYFWSVVTPVTKGVHQLKSDVPSTNLSSGRGDDSVCPELTLKGYHSRFVTVLLTSRSPKGENRD